MVPVRARLFTLFLVSSKSLAFAFAPSHHHTVQESLTSHRAYHSSRNLYSTRYSPLFAKDSDWDDDWDDDDDEVLALQDEDWRSFRAKLFMSERVEKEDQTQPGPAQGVGDLDGIGSIFSDDFVLDATTVSSSTLDGMTPLDGIGSIISDGFVLDETTVPASDLEGMRAFRAKLFMSEDDDDDDDDDVLVLQDDDWRAFQAKLFMSEGVEEENLQDDDWRAFRAKLFMREDVEKETQPKSGSTQDVGDFDGIGSIFRDDSVLDATTVSSSTLEGMTPLDPSQWAYESGDVIEQGAVILGGVEQEFGFGLRQQYFHKASILILDHDENTFTKGIILNRPTDLMLEDDINEGKRWPVWFGGEVEGLNAEHPDIVCLHSLKGEMATKASVPLMKDIQWTSFTNAKKLVKAGVAEVNDFWVFVGYAGWGPGQLKGELESNSWYMVATDSQTLLQELPRQGEGADPRDAGLGAWTLLMNMIGRSDTAKEHSDTFDDLMLKEWAFKHLLSSPTRGGAGIQQRDPREFNKYPELVDQLMRRVMDPEIDSDSMMTGALIRASSADRSPFLLDKQELHKSIVLIIADDENASVGVVLNRPSSKGLDIKVGGKNTGGARVVTIPMRFGGDYAVQGEEALLWLHSSQTLRQMNIGSPIGAHQQQNGIWKCTAQDVITAIGEGSAEPSEFLVVSGVSIWEKNTVGTMSGIEGEIELKKFEIIPNSTRDNVWSVILRQQEVLTKTNVGRSLALAEAIWEAANANGRSQSSKGKKQNPIGELGEGFDEEDDSFVFKSDVKVSKLSDDALQSWIATFLLGMPGHYLP